ncbi:MAG: GIY-YIG nuclease family protein [Burkholderiales bacterium]
MPKGKNLLVRCPKTPSTSIYSPANLEDFVGVTSNLERRIFEHKQKSVEGFTKKYNIDRLVYFEQTEDVLAAANQDVYSLAQKLFRSGLLQAPARRKK